MTFLTPEQAAELLQLAPDTIRAMAKRGTIPARKVGRLWRFLESELMGVGQCRSTVDPELASGGVVSRLAVGRFAARQAQRIARRPKSSSTSSANVIGVKFGSARRSTVSATPPSDGSGNEPPSAA